VGPAAAAVGIAALWPVTAFVLNPLLLPAGLLLGGAVLVVFKWPEYGLALVIALSPLIGAHVGQPSSVGIAFPLEPLRFLVPLMIFGLLVYGFFAHGVNPRRLPAVLLGVGLLIVAAVLSTFQAIDASRSVVDILLLFNAAALFLAIHNICRTRKQLLLVVAGILAALLIASIHGIVQHFTGVFSTQGVASGEEVLGRVQGSFGHPNEYASFVAMLLPLAIVVALAKSLPSQLRLLGGIAAVAAVPAINYSYSRGAIATLIVGSVIWLLILRPKLGVVTAIVVSVGVVAFAPGVLKERFDPAAAGGDIGLRRDVAEGALDIYSQHPLLGVGVGNFQLAYAQGTAVETAPQKRLFHNEQLLVPTAAPSQYLNTLVEQGLIGLTALAVFLALVLATIYRACKSRDPTVRELALGIGMGISAFFLYSFLDPLLQEVTVLMLFAMVAVAATAESVFAPEEEPVAAEYVLGRPPKLGGRAAPSAS
jgi:O-antigen ligase